MFRSDVSPVLVQCCAHVPDVDTALGQCWVYVIQGFRIHVLDGLPLVLLAELLTSASCLACWLPDLRRQTQEQCQHFALKLVSFGGRWHVSDDGWTTGWTRGSPATPCHTMPRHGRHKRKLSAWILNVIQTHGTCTVQISFCETRWRHRKSLLDGYSVKIMLYRNRSPILHCIS